MVPPAATGKKKSKKNENLYVCNIVGFFKDYTGISTYIYLKKKNDKIKIIYFLLWAYVYVDNINEVIINIKLLDVATPLEIQFVFFVCHNIKKFIVAVIFG